MKNSGSKIKECILRGIVFFFGVAFIGVSIGFICKVVDNIANSLEERHPSCSAIHSSYWYDKFSGKYYKDKGCTEELSDDDINKYYGHATEEQPGHLPNWDVTGESEYQSGQYEYWKCKNCGKYFWDKLGTKAIDTIEETEYDYKCYVDFNNVIGSTSQEKSGADLLEVLRKSPTAPAGFVFDGWYVNDERIDISAYVPQSSDTIKARYASAEVLKIYDGTVEGKVFAVDATYYYNEPIALPDGQELAEQLRTKYGTWGWDFANWTTEQYGGGEAVDADYKVTKPVDAIYAKWVKAITFEPNAKPNGLVIENSTLTYSVVYGSDLSDDINYLPKSNKQIYVTEDAAFVMGWYDNKDLTGENYADIDVWTMSNPPEKLYADVGYKITIDYNNGTQTAKQIETVEEFRGLATLLDATPNEPDGFAFDGWYVDGEKIQDVSAYRPNKSVTIKARYASVAPLNVYDGTVGGETLISDLTYYYNEPIALPDGQELAEQLRTKYGTWGWDFAGYYTMQFGSGQNITQSMIVDKVLSAVYAKWMHGIDFIGGPFDSAIKTHYDVVYGVDLSAEKDYLPSELQNPYTNKDIIIDHWEDEQGREYNKNTNTTWTMNDPPTSLTVKLYNMNIAYYITIPAFDESAVRFSSLEDAETRIRRNLEGDNLNFDIFDIVYERQRGEFDSATAAEWIATDKDELLLYARQYKVKEMILRMHLRCKSPLILVDPLTDGGETPTNIYPYYNERLSKSVTWSDLNMPADEMGWAFNGCYFGGKQYISPTAALTNEKYVRAMFDDDDPTAPRLNVRWMKTVVLDHVLPEGDESSVNIYFGEAYELQDQQYDQAQFDGATFAGWYTGSAGVGNAYKAGTWSDKQCPPDRLYAKIMFTLGFNYDGGTGTDHLDVAYGAQISGLPKGNLTGWDFDGWYTQQYGFGDHITDGYIYQWRNNFTLTACWEGTVNYKVPAFRNKVDNATPQWTNHTAVDVIYGREFDVNAVDAPGASGAWTFKGWFHGNGDSFIGEKKLLSKFDNNREYGNTSLYAYYVTTINFNYVLNDRVERIDVHYGENITLPKPHYDSVVNQGANFAGWYSQVHGDGTYYDKYCQLWQAWQGVSGQPQLYANIQFTVTFNLKNKDAHFSQGKKDTITVTYGKQVNYGKQADEFDEAPTLIGRDFDKWTVQGDSDKELKKDTVYSWTKNITCEAVWTNHEYNIYVYNDDDDYIYVDWIKSDKTDKVLRRQTEGKTDGKENIGTSIYGAKIKIRIGSKKCQSRIKVTTNTSNETVDHEKVENGDHTWQFDMPADDITIEYYCLTDHGCVSEGTLITLADGTQKPVEQLTGDEMLLVWNLFTGQFDAAPILFVASHNKEVYEIIKLGFSDGTSVKVVGSHGFWDYDQNRYVYIGADAENYIGHWFNKQGTDSNGNLINQKVQLANVEFMQEQTVAYSPNTYGHLCYYVNGMLSVPSNTAIFVNIFDVDPQTMKIDEEKMAADIEQYGLFTYEEFIEYLPMQIPELAFDACNDQYLKVALGKGLITWDDIFAMLDLFVAFWPKE